jgi:hypothetical protein
VGDVITSLFGVSSLTGISDANDAKDNVCLWRLGTVFAVVLNLFDDNDGISDLNLSIENEIGRTIGDDGGVFTPGAGVIRCVP